MMFTFIISVAHSARRSGAPPRVVVGFSAIALFVVAGLVRLSVGLSSAAYLALVTAALGAFGVGLAGEGSAARRRAAPSLPPRDPAIDRVVLQ